ncbi:MAG TPA: hypothetical protein VHK27_06190 [Gammaproteobacteria bacterium]|nr:hypothetical protein [Gammaproteobacteria bacterium]
MTGIVTFVLPANWRTIAGRDVTTQCTASTVGKALHWLCETYPVFHERIFTADEELAPWIIVCLGNERMRTRRELDLPIPDEGEVLQVIPSLMGG